MKRWLVRALILGAGLAVLGGLIAASGVVPLKASAGHWRVTEWFLQFAKRRSVDTHSLGVNTPGLNDPALILKGAGHFEFGCRPCHGAPGAPVPRIALGMLPPPPPLGLRSEQYDSAELFHIVKHGLKFTGMPAWPSPHRDDEVWAMVAFLRALPGMDSDRYRRLVHGESEEAMPIEGIAPMETARAIPGAVERSCARCHGNDGLGRGSEVFPRLAGQRREYLVHALVAYARGDRASGIMEPVSAGLTQEDIRDLADYYAGMETGPSAPPRPEDAERIEQGRRIAHEGIPRQRVPACISCHDPEGRDARPEYPLLSGQPARYLDLQMELFQQHKRGGSPYAHIMQEVAENLKPEQRRAAAAYFASRSRRESPSPDNNETAGEP